MSDITHHADELLQFIRGFDNCVIAYSGGVDSAVVCKAAQLAIPDKALAVMSGSQSVAQGEVKAAREVAEQIGIPFQVITTEEFQNEAYLSNGPDRCYHCKSELYQQLAPIASAHNNAVIFNGTNTDDLGDYRPGLQAASEYQVVSPLAECGFDKASVRELAAEWGLSVAEKPATPCLSSRIAYGEEVTEARLQMIDSAERYLRSFGIGSVRVRYHAGDLARIEVDKCDIPILISDNTFVQIESTLRELGFRFVTLDLAGFRSGSLNQLVQLNAGSSYS